MGMLRFIAIMCMLGAGQFISAQCPSLIPNGGFETYSALPNDDCGWSLATGWTNAATSSECSTNNGTPTIFICREQVQMLRYPSIISAMFFLLRETLL